MLLSAWSKKLLNEKGPASAGPFGWACGAGATTGCALDARQVPPGRFDVLDKPARCGPQVVADEGEAVAAAHEARGRLVVRQVGLAGDLEVPASFASRPYGRRQDGLGVVLQQDDGHSTRVKRERQDVAQSSHGDLVGGVAGAQPPNDSTPQGAVAAANFSTHESLHAQWPGVPADYYYYTTLKPLMSSIVLLYI